MKRQTRRQKQRFKIKVPKLMFTLDQLVFLRKALLPLEQIVLMATSSNPKVNLALATVTQVQTKVNSMIQQREWSKGVGFDANEMVILQTAVWIFQIRLDCAELSPEHVKLKKQCETLNILLAPLSKQHHNETDRRSI